MNLHSHMILFPFPDPEIDLCVFLGHARKVVREAGEIFLINTSRLQILRWSELCQSSQQSDRLYFCVLGNVFIWWVAADAGWSRCLE